MVVCLAYLMSGVVCKPFRFFTVALCVGRVVCFGCLWKDEERFVPRPLFFCVFELRFGPGWWYCVWWIGHSPGPYPNPFPKAERTGESHREKGNVTEVRRVAL